MNIAVLLGILVDPVPSRGDNEAAEYRGRTKLPRLSLGSYSLQGFRIFVIFSSIHMRIHIISYLSLVGSSYCLWMYINLNRSFALAPNRAKNKSITKNINFQGTIMSRATCLETASHVVLRDWKPNPLET